MLFGITDTDSAGVSRSLNNYICPFTYNLSTSRYNSPGHVIGLAVGY